MIPTDIQQIVEVELSLKVRNSTPQGGGCIHNAQKLQTDNGLFFLKYNNPSSYHNFEVEAKGLEFLAQNSSFSIPQVHLLGKTGKHAFLLLDFIQSSRPSSSYWENFGRKLADLHSHSHSQFGLDYDNYIGSLPQPNGFREDWLTFFIECRIQPKLKQGVDQGSISMSWVTKFDKFFTRLPSFFPEEPPALLHGDLWGGNIMTDAQGAATIFDPAVYYGHREMELAFMTMFDSQPPTFYQAYQEQKPLGNGWEERLEVYNLYPLLVHVILFGPSYLGGIKRTLGRFV